MDNARRELTAIESALAAQVTALTAQRDTLLAACEAALYVLHPGVVGMIGNQHGDTDMQLAAAAQIKLRAAIAAAKQGAARE